MNVRLGCILCLLLGGLSSARAATQIVIVEGLGGEQRYSEAFAEQRQAIAQASRSLVPESDLHVVPVDAASREAILELFAGLSAGADSNDTIYMYLVGHGSFDEHDYKFNLPGPDLSGADILQLLEEHPAGTQVLIDTSSASGTLKDLLQNERRLLILATRSGAERHATRFGTYFSAALADTAADTNKNNSVSVGEAFRFAERLVADFYARNDQLATEHPQMIGERADRLVLARLESAVPVSVDTELQALLAERQQMNNDIEALRLRRDAMAADAYQAELLQRMLDLAQLENRIEARQEALQNAN